MSIVLPSFDYERNFSTTGGVVGLDEAGCGPWAGPVVAGAVIFFTHHALPEDLKPLIRDSKTLSKIQRERAFELLQKYEGEILHFSPGIATVEEIDSLNIAKASHLAMSRAMAHLPISPAHALVDGIRKPILPCSVKMITKGDRYSVSIAAASIVAKVTRDRIMDQLHEEHPAYGWNTNAGYGTKIHQQALRDFGVTLHHRRSYAPIARLLAG